MVRPFNLTISEELFFVAFLRPSGIEKPKYFWDDVRSKDVFKEDNTKAAATSVG